METGLVLKGKNQLVVKILLKQTLGNHYPLLLHTKSKSTKLIRVCSPQWRAIFPSLSGQRLYSLLGSSGIFWPIIVSHFRLPNPKPWYNLSYSVVSKASQWATSGVRWGDCLP